MLSISVKVEGLETFMGSPELKGALRTALRQSAQAIKSKAEQNLSGRFVRIRTGKLRRGMRVRIQESQGLFVATIRNVVFYGAILEEGAAAHTVPSAVAQSSGGGLRPEILRFQAGGKTIYARAIVHPGLRPRRWFASAVQEVLPQLESIFERELGAAVTRRTGLILQPGA